MIENPFSTSFVRPGKVPFLFAPGEDAGQLVQRLKLNGWWGQITGVHGAGKSTLLHSLKPHLEASQREIRWITLRGGQRRLQLESDEPAKWGAQTQLVIDGYEQLSWFSRWRLRRAAGRRGAGLLVTSHASAGLPLLIHVETPLVTVQKIVAHLLSQQPQSLHLPAPVGQADSCGGPLEISAEAVKNCFLRHNGNIRETLFALYDLYEQQRINRL